jgi:mRNA-degrading endonuclease toxin of MazEF toxin-antitoxin module
MSVSFSQGDIVLVKYSFGIHPAYVVYDNGDQDLVVCMITSTRRGEPEEIEIPQGEGNIRHTSYIRTHKIATVPKNIVSAAIVGSVSSDFARGVALKLASWLKLPDSQ